MLYQVVYNSKSYFQCVHHRLVPWKCFQRHCHRSKLKSWYWQKKNTYLARILVKSLKRKLAERHGAAESAEKNSEASKFKWVATCIWKGEKIGVCRHWFRNHPRTESRGVWPNQRRKIFFLAPHAPPRHYTAAVAVRELCRKFRSACATSNTQVRFRHNRHSDL